MRAFLFIGLCLALTACFDKGDCLIANTTQIKFKLVKKEKRTVADTVTFTSINTPGYWEWITTPSGEITLTAFGLNVDPTRNQMEYVFQYEGRSDTLVVSYNNQTIVLAPDCGSFLYQKDLSIERSTFGEDNVRITDPSLLTTVTNNIEIFL